MKVIVTRPRAQAGPLVGRLEALGHEVVECPLIEIERTSDEPIDCAGYEWAIVTSPNGADEVARRARNLPKVAAVGPGTAEKLREPRHRAGVRPAGVVGRTGCSTSFRGPAGKIVYLAAENARRRPIDALRRRLRARSTAPCCSSPIRPRATSSCSRPGSAARAYAWTGGKAPAVSIGPETTRVAESVGIEVAVEADAHDLDGLVAAVQRFSER